MPGFRYSDRPYNHRFLALHVPGIPMPQGDGSLHLWRDLFYACCDEVAGITFLEAMCRILMLATYRLKQLGTFCEKTAAAFFDYEHRFAVCWLVKEQVGDRLKCDPES